VNREPPSVPGQSGAPPTPAIKIKTEAQLARNKRKFLQLKEKRKARELMASQKYRLAKHPAPTSEPEAASQPPSESIPLVAIEMDIPATKGGKPEEPVPTTNQAQPTPTTDLATVAEDAWLAAPRLSLEQLPNHHHGIRRRDSVDSHTTLQKHKAGREDKSGATSTGLRGSRSRSTTTDVDTPYLTRSYAHLATILHRRTPSDDSPSTYT